MVSFHGIAAAGRTLERFLDARFAAEPPVEDETTRAVLVQTEQFDVSALEDVSLPALSVFLYRVEVNKTMRAAWSAVGSFDGRGHLPLDLHFLLTAWADDAEHEQLVLGKAMECLEATPILTGPLLYSAPGWQDEPVWSAGEAMQVVPEDVSAETLVGLFDSLGAEYRLSTGYLARILRLDTRAEPQPQPVTTAVAGLVPSVEDAP